MGKIPHLISNRLAVDFSSLIVACKLYVSRERKQEKIVGSSR